MCEHCKWINWIKSIRVVDISYLMEWTYMHFYYIYQILCTLSGQNEYKIEDFNAIILNHIIECFATHISKSFSFYHICEQQHNIDIGLRIHFHCVHCTCLYVMGPIKCLYVYMSMHSMLSQKINQRPSTSVTHIHANQKAYKWIFIQKLPKTCKTLSKNKLG